MCLEKEEAGHSTTCYALLLVECFAPLNACLIRDEAFRGVCVCF